MPDTEENRAAFGKPSARNGAAAFPQVRLMALLAVGQRRLMEVAWAAYRGKGSGESALMMEIVERIVCEGLLFLLDAGLFSFDLLMCFQRKQGKFIVKAPYHVKPKLTKRSPDGSWLAEIQSKIVDPEVPLAPNGRKHWKTVSLTVRVIHVVIPGFRPFWLMTNLLDPGITADRPRRPRLNPRLVKVKISKFARKNANHKSQLRDIVQDLKIIEITTPNLSTAQAS